MVRGREAKVSPDQRKTQHSAQPVASTHITALPVLQLQRTIGNQAAERLLRSHVHQATLKISRPGDIYEQEAERVAEDVIRMPAPTLQLQRKDAGPMSPADAGAPAPTPADTACKAKPIDLTKIPGVMDAKGWARGAALMRRWFANPPAIAPAYGASDTMTIKMAWVLGFSRAKTVYDSIFKDKIYVNIPAQGEIAKLLKLLGKDKGGTFDFAKPVTALDPTYYINHRAVTDGIFGTLDDMAAALANFDLRAVVSGIVEKEAGKDGAPDRFKVSITEVGVYVQDSYDFEGSQQLGCWNVCTNDVGKISCGGGEYVSNEDFRNWRTANAKGGDFLVYSDVLATSLKSPEAFYLP